MKTLQEEMVQIGGLNLTINGKEHKLGGYFIDDVQKKECDSPSCEPPKFIHIPQGKKYVHVCPKCGKRQILKPMNITY